MRSPGCGKGLLCHLFSVVGIALFISSSAPKSQAFLTRSSDHAACRTKAIGNFPSSILFGLRWDPKKTNREAEKVFVDFPTPAQRKTLKKEVQKLQSRKLLVAISMPQDDDGANWIMEQGDDENDEDQEYECPFETSTVQAVWDAFIDNETEVLQVRGLSRNNKASVFTVAEILCWALETLQEESIADSHDDDDDKDAIPHEVTLLSTKGHAAILYCPVLELDHPNKIVLRTSVGQKNVWKARVKAPRDNRGQIIPKELREESYRQQEEQQ